MTLKLKFWLGFLAAAVLALLIVTGAFFFYYTSLPQPRQIEIITFLHHNIYLFLLPPTTLLIGAAIAYHIVVKNYLLPLNKIVEDTMILARVNAGHRLQVQGGSILSQLAEVINDAADRFYDLRKNVEARIAQANASLEEEKNTLAALISQLDEGVLVCNLEGQILLYNRQAQHYLSKEGVAGRNGGDPESGGFVGLGRSVFGVIEKEVLTHALGDLEQRMKKARSRKISQFVTTSSQDQLLRVRMVPVLDDREQMSGFILVIYDITERVEADARRDYLLQSLTEGIRASLANIRAAVETLEAYPTMPKSQRDAFIDVILQESRSLSGFLNQTVHDFSEHFKSQWSLENMLCRELLSAAQRKVHDHMPVAMQIEHFREEVWIKVDSYTMVQVLYYLIHQLRDQLEVREVTCRIGKEGKFACIDILWEGDALSSEMFRAWKDQILQTHQQHLPYSLQEVLEKHDAEIWSQREQESGRFYLRLLLPAAPPPREPDLPVRVVAEERPVFYDFDLFHQAGQKPELDERPLVELTYTVFDTETTGLSPSEGDEIVSIGAVRVVNGRMLRGEVFDQLVNPRRPVPPGSVEIHGIQPEMLRNQPSIEQVLPVFHAFAKDTVLVAHNAAFDMRFLQLKESASGVSFINPILDTLLLSAVVHPHQDGHSLDAIARRLGITIIGRHTALGDAVVTAEVLLKLIPFLNEQGIHTLRQAREASQKTFYARIKY